MREWSGQRDRPVGGGVRIQSRHQLRDRGAGPRAELWPERGGAVAAGTAAAPPACPTWGSTWARLAARRTWSTPLTPARTSGSRRSPRPSAPHGEPTSTWVPPVRGDPPTSWGYSSPENRSHADWRVIPSASPICAQVTPSDRALETQAVRLSSTWVAALATGARLGRTSSRVASASQGATWGTDEGLPSMTCEHSATHWSQMQMKTCH